jgi:hypothetical protein
MALCSSQSCLSLSVIEPEFAGLPRHGVITLLPEPPCRYYRFMLKKAWEYSEVIHELCTYRVSTALLCFVTLYNCWIEEVKKLVVQGDILGTEMTDGRR